MTTASTIPFQKFFDQADSGDIILWTGSSKESFIVELLSESVFSHASMVIVDPTSGHKYLYQSVSEALASDPLSKQGVTEHDGVQAGDLKTVMTIIKDRYLDMPTYRKMVWPDRPANWQQQVWDMARTLDGIRFPANMGELALLLINGRFDNPTVEHLQPLFCSGLIARMLQQLKVLAIDEQHYCNSFFPKDFSSWYPGHMTLLQGSYADDVLIDMSGM